MAKWISSALVWMSSVSIIWYLWNSTVRVEISRFEAISFAERPSARSWRTSRCRGVNGLTGSPACSGPPFREDPGYDLGAPSGCTLNFQRPVHQLNAFPHARQTQAPAPSRIQRIETDAVVPNGEEQPVVHLPQGDARGACTGVPGDVIQRLLRHAEKADRRILSDGGRQLILPNTPLQFS